MCNLVIGTGPRVRLLCLAVSAHLLTCGLATLAENVTAAEPAAEVSEIRRLPPVATQLAEEQPAASSVQVHRDGQILPAALSFLDDNGADGDEAASVQDQLDDLTKNYESLTKKYDDLSSQQKLSLLAGHSDGAMKVVGRVHADYWAFSDTTPGINAFETGDPLLTPQDRVGFRRLRFGVRGTVWENMEYRIEMEFALGNRSEFRDAWLGFRELPVLQTVLIGNQKRPYGLDHLNSSRFNVFLERPFVIESFNQDARRLGIQSYGITRDEVWNWRYGVFNQRLIQDEGLYVSDHYQLEFAGRLANNIWYDEQSGGRGYAHWAVSGNVAKPDGSTDGDPENLGIGRSQNEARFRHRPEARSTTRWLDTGRIAGADTYGLLGLESVLNLGEWQFVAEYQNLWLSRDPGFGPDIHLHGGYAYIAYFLTGEHMPWARRRGTLARIKPLENFFLVNTCNSGVRGGWGAWQIAFRWSYANFTDDNVLGGIGESLTFGLNWYWNPYARLQFNYIYGDIHDHAPVAGLTFGNYSILGTRFMIDF